MAIPKINISVPVDLRARIKVSAAQAGVLMRDLIVSALLEKFPKKKGK